MWHSHYLFAICTLIASLTPSLAAVHDLLPDTPYMENFRIPADRSSVITPNGQKQYALHNLSVCYTQPPPAAYCLHTSLLPSACTYGFAEMLRLFTTL